MGWILKLVGLAGGGTVSLPVIIGGAIAAITALGGVAALGMNAWENHKISLRNEGANQCIGAVKAEHYRQLQEENKRLSFLMSQEQERAQRLEVANREIRAESAKVHVEISEAMKAHNDSSGTVCRIPDRVVDAINRPLKK